MIHHFPRKKQIKDGSFDKVEHVHPLVRCDKCKGYYRQGKALFHVCPSEQQRRVMKQEMRRDV